MATFKKYRAAIAMEMAQLQQALNSDVDYNTISYRDLNGNQYSKIGTRLNGTNTTNIQGTLPTVCPFSNLIPVCTGDDTFSFDDYQITAVGSTTYTVSGVSVSASGGFKSYTIQVSNSGQNEITVKCVKFKKTVCNTSSTSARTECLTCAYFLDENEWVTIPAGGIGYLTVTMTVGGTN